MREYLKPSIEEEVIEIEDIIAVSAGGEGNVGTGGSEKPAGELWN